MVENRQFVSIPSSFNALARGDPLPFFGVIVIFPETRMMGLPYGEETMIVGRTVWTQSTSVTDGQNYDHKDRATHSVAR